VALQIGTRVSTELQNRMLFIRMLEERLQELCDEGKAGDLHFSKGQEAISVGVCAALKETDYVVTHHRTIAHAIAKGVPLRPLLGEIMGKAEGLNGGMAGEMHLSDLARRFMFSFQLVGTCVSVAAGVAWAVKNHLKTDDVVVVFHGDAATSNGQWHEGLNIAAVQKLPLLLVCENNHLAGNVRPEHYQPVEFVSDRAKAYGIPGWRADGNDIEEVTLLATTALRYIREFGGPVLIEYDTTRLGRHKQGMGDLRTQEEKTLLALRDPLRDVAFDPDLRRSYEAEIEAVLEALENSPDPVLSQEA